MLSTRAGLYLGVLLKKRRISFDNIVVIFDSIIATTDSIVAKTENIVAKTDNIAALGVSSVQ